MRQPTCMLLNAFTSKAVDTVSPLDFPLTSAELMFLAALHIQDSLSLHVANEAVSLQLLRAQTTAAWSPWPFIAMACICNKYTNNTSMSVFSKLGVKEK